MKKIILVLTILCILIPSNAKADMVFGLENKITLNDKFVLVQFSKDNEEYNSKNQKYWYPGLYKNDKATKPIWIFNNSLTYENLELSKNSKYLTAINGYASNGDEVKQLEQYGVKFYKNGKLEKLYKIAYFIEPSDVSLYTVGSFIWKENFEYNGNYLWVRTINQEDFYFDIRTGKDVPKRYYDNNIRTMNIDLILIIGVGVFLFSLVLFIKKEKYFKKI